MATIARNFLPAGALAVGAMFASLAIAWPDLLYPIGQDQGTFLYVARVWIDGGLPFRDALDTKPVGIYALYALAEILFGRTAAAYRILEIALLGASIIAFRSILSTLGSHFATAAAATATFLLAAFYYIGQEFWARGQAEFPLGIAALVLLALLLRADKTGRLTLGMALAAGLLVGVSALLKQNYAVLALGFVYLAARSGPTDTGRGRLLLTRLGTFSLAAAVPFLLLLGYFAAQGAAREFLHGMFVLPYQYAKSGAVPGQSLLSYGSTLAYNVIFVAAAGVALWHWGRSGLPAHRLVLVSIVALVLAIAVQRKFWTYHTISLLPMLALCVTVGLFLLPSLLPLPSKAAGIALFVLGALQIVLLALPIYGPSLSGKTPLPRKDESGSSFYINGVRNTSAYLRGKIDQPQYFATFDDSYLNAAIDYQLGRRLRALAGPRESVQLFEFRPSVYAYAERFAPHRFFFASLILLVRGKERARLEEEFLRLTYATRRPDWIVFGIDGPWLAPEIERFSPARHGYELTERFENRYHQNSPLKRVTLGIFRNRTVRPGGAQKAGPEHSNRK